MKFLVDKLPKDKCDCRYAEWKPNPPFIERPGDYICNLTNKICNLTFDSIECEGLKVNE